MRLDDQHEMARPSAVLKEVLRQTRRAIRELETHGEGTGEGDDGVHECRRSLKRVRAGLRLIRATVESKEYELVRRLVKDAGQLLSDARDAHVLKETARGLCAKAHGVHEETSGVKLAGVLSWSIGGECLSKKKVRRVVKKLKAAGRNIRRWKVAEDETRVLERGLDESVARVRRARHTAFEEGSDEALHDWRKELQQLRYQLAILGDAAGAHGKKVLNQAHELSQVLGDDHDLAMLEHRMLQWPISGLSVATRVALTGMAERERLRLKRRARTLGIRMK